MERYSLEKAQDEAARIKKIAQYEKASRTWEKEGNPTESDYKEAETGLELYKISEDEIKTIKDLVNRKLTEEEKSKIESKVFDVLNSPDTVLHRTKINYFFSILKHGLLSCKIARRFIKGVCYSGYGSDVQEAIRNRDVISMALN